MKDSLSNCNISTNNLFNIIRNLDSENVRDQNIKVYMLQYMIDPFGNLQKLLEDLALFKVLSFPHGKKLILHLFTKKIMNRMIITADLCRFPKCVVNALSASYLIPYIRCFDNITQIFVSIWF